MLLFFLIAAFSNETQHFPHKRFTLNAFQQLKGHNPHIADRLNLKHQHKVLRFTHTSLTALEKSAKWKQLDLVNTNNFCLKEKVRAAD